MRRVALHQLEPCSQKTEPAFVMHTAQSGSLMGTERPGSKTGGARWERVNKLGSVLVGPAFRGMRGGRMAVDWLRHHLAHLP